MKFIAKIQISLAIILCLLCIIEPYFGINTVEADGYLVNEVKNNMKEGNTEDIEDDVTSPFKDVVGNLLGIIQLVAGFLTVIIVALSGLDYVMLANSEMKAELKKKMLPIIIALVLIFGAVSIAEFIVGAFEGSEETTTVKTTLAVINTIIT